MVKVHQTWSKQSKLNLRQPYANRTIIFRMAHRVSWYFHNIQIWRWSILHYYGFHGKFYLVPTILLSTSPWHTADQINFLFHVIFFCVWFLPQRCFRPSPKKRNRLSAQNPRPAAARQQQQTQTKQQTIRQTSIIFRHVEFTLAHRRSKWTSSDASSSHVIYPFITKSW